MEVERRFLKEIFWERRMKKMMRVRTEEEKVIRVG